MNVLTAALVVCRECLPTHDVEASHVVENINKYLDTFSGQWTMEQACNSKLSTRALDFLRVHGCSWRSNSIDHGLAHQLMDRDCLRVLQWLYEHFRERIAWKYWKGTSLLDAAASRGNLAIVQWLHENFDDESSTRAMDVAAANGHLDIVRFLHDNRSEGCTKAALDRASRNGHIDVVRFLHENRDEGCSSEAMRQGAACGHLKVVQYLHANRNEGHPPSALRMAAKYGQLEVAEWLFGVVREQRRGDVCIRSAAEIALEARQPRVATMLEKKLKKPRLK